MIDLANSLRALATDRPLFHSEADFQHALAWQIHQQLPAAAIRLELPVAVEDDRFHVDIWVVQGGYSLAIELKYKVRALTLHLGQEKYELKSQSAQDLGRYDFVKDICRLEQIVRTRRACVGHAILLTNDSAYWSHPVDNRTVDVDFRLHQGRTLSGTLSWKGAGPGTVLSREKPIALAGVYPLSWEPYSRPSTDRYGELHYLLVPVS